MASNWKDRRVTGIVGVPGDRDDKVIVHAARVAARGFNKVIVREDHDRRGREPGAVANLLCHTVREVSPGTECEIVLDEVEALRRAVSNMVKGEVIVLFYEKLQPVQSVLEEFAAQPVPSLPPMPVQPEPKVQPRYKRSFPSRFGFSRTRRIGRGPIPVSPPA